MQQLSLLLDQWQDANYAEISKQELAVRIIGEFESKALVKTVNAEKRKILCRFLDLTGKSEFLLAAGDYQTRKRWTELVCKILQAIDFFAERPDGTSCCRPSESCTFS